ncbi:MAG TPA: RidA family protein [Bacteroidales bacterium]|nr:RidA family protein [Bacteroidales bacterium]
MKRQKFSSNSPWEDKVGYSRAIRVGNIIELSGTVAVDDCGNVVGAGKAYEQTKYIINKILQYIEKAGGKKEHVVRTRIFVTDISQWESIGRAHGEFFKDVKPVTTMVEVKSLISKDYLVEIEATAIIF